MAGSGFLTDFPLHFLRPPCKKLFFVQGRLAQQPQKLARVHSFLIRDIPQHLLGRLAVDRFRELHVHLNRFEFRGDHKPNRPGKFSAGQLPATGQS
jgi:hypothetical protein